MCHISCRENYGITAASPENGAVIEKFEQKLRMYKSPLNQIQLRTLKKQFLNYLEEGVVFQSDDNDKIDYVLGYIRQRRSRKM